MEKIDKESNFDVTLDNLELFSALQYKFWGGFMSFILTARDRGKNCRVTAVYNTSSNKIDIHFSIDD